MRRTCHCGSRKWTPVSRRTPYGLVYPSWKCEKCKAIINSPGGPASIVRRAPRYAENMVVAKNRVGSHLEDCLDLVLRGAI
jgi:hypothetical protein